MLFDFGSERAGYRIARERSVMLYRMAECPPAGCALTGFGTVREHVLRAQEGICTC
jgi:hypothetical protein